MREPMEMSAAQSVQFLASHTVGRVAFTNPMGPRIVPIGYALQGTVIVFETPRTASWRPTAATIDQVWLRLRDGQAAKPAAQELGLCTGTCACLSVAACGIRPEPRRRAPSRAG